MRDMPERMVKCPECRGRYGEYETDEYGDTTWVDCTFCDGTGEVFESEYDIYMDMERRYEIMDYKD